ncbi:MAG TPA: NifB/NifX family molybdenum-iron cluster-binding protein [candidate division Zixibacteria bacterium]|nr:NifB/NifX family molybdenum-iron cluster-binding protein [candidate division Zixibacteria bacterium]
MSEKIAIPICRGRVSPVLDSAEQIWICEVDSADAGSPRLVEAGPNDIQRRTEFFCRLGVNTLLCGALSRPFHYLLERAGIVVIPWLTGTVEEILTAYFEGRLDADCYRMPGCRRRRGGCRGRIRGRQNRNNNNRKF